MSADLRWSKGLDVGALLPYAVALGTGTAVASICRGFMGSETLLCVLLGGLLLAPLAIRYWTGTFDLFEPLVIIVGVYFVYFVFAPLVRFATDDLRFIGRNFEADYLPALLAVLLAVCAMWLGYALPVGPTPAPPARARRQPPRAALRATRQLGWLLVCGALCCMMLWALLARRSLLTFLLPGLLPGSRSGDEGGGTDIPYLFLSIEWFIPALVLVMAGGGLPRVRSRVIAVLLVTIVYVSIGFRYRIVVLWLATGMLTFLQARRRPRIRYLVLPGLIAFLAAGWLAQARLYFRTGGMVGSLGFNVRDTVLAGLSDTRIFETFGAVLRVIPHFINYSGTLPFTYVFLLPIPRSLWFDKPLPVWLQNIASSVGTPESPGAGLFVPHFGEFYVAFGWPGIVVGMLLFGMALKCFWRWFRADPEDPWRQAVFVLNNALLFQVVIRGYMAQIVQEWCFIVLPAVVLIAIARRHVPPSFTRAEPQPVRSDRHA